MTVINSNKVSSLALKSYLEVILYKAYAEFKAEATRYYLGTIWWVLEPLIHMGAFYLVFGLGLEGGHGIDFVLFLLTGLTAWKLFATTVTRAGEILRSNKGLILQANIPKIVFPIYLLITNTIKYLITMFFLLVFMVIIGKPVIATWSFLPAVIILEVLFIAGTSFILAALVPLIPDLQILVGYAVLVLLFMSGVFYDYREMVSEAARTIIALNPMTQVIDFHRGILLRGELPDFIIIGILLISSILLITIGIWLLKRFDKVLPKMI